MKQYRYAAVKNKTSKNEAYGLLITEKKNGEKHMILLLPNVTQEKKLARSLAKLFTEEQLDPIHVNGVLEDML